MSEFKVSKELEKTIRNSTDYETMRQELRNAAEAQGVTLASSFHENFAPVNTARFSRDTDPYRDQPSRDPETGRFVSQEPPAAARTFSKTEVIAGREMTFEASSQEELDNLILQSYQIAEALKPAQAQTPVNSPKQLSEFDRAELDLKFRRGEISTQDFLEQSGEIDTYLEKKGVSVTTLRETIHGAQQATVTQSWADATQRFLNSEAGADWIGGPKNLEMIGLLIQKLGLVDAEDKFVALTTAYNEMKRTGMVFDTPERQAAEAAEKQAAINSKVAEELQNASPVEIIDAYRTAIGENAVGNTFRETYRKGRPDSSGIFNN